MRRTARLKYSDMIRTDSYDVKFNFSLNTKRYISAYKGNALFIFLGDFGLTMMRIAI